MKVFMNLAWFLNKKTSVHNRNYFIIWRCTLELVAPKVIGIVVDEINDETLTTDKLLKWVVLLVIVGITMYILRYIWRIMIFGFAKISSPITKNLYEYFTKMSPSFYQSNRTGDLMAHATNDIQAIQQTAGAGVLTLVDSLAVGDVYS